jgi:predicted RNase H-like HicB family nuclease
LKEVQTLPAAVGGSGTVLVVSEPLRLTIVYEDAGDGWVLARIPQVRGALSQGQTRDQARDDVIDALREVLAVRFGAPPTVQEATDSDSVELTIAA